MKGSFAERKLHHETLLCYLLFLIVGFKYLLPPYLNGLAEQVRVLDLLLTLLAMGLIVFFFLWKKCIPRPSILMVAAVYLCLILSTLLNHGAIVKVLLHTLQVILLCMLVDAVRREPDAKIALLRAVRDVTLVFYVANFFLMYILPGGIPSITEGKEYPWFLYGSMNTVIKYVLPGLCCSLILDGMRERKGIVPSVPTLIMMIGLVVSAVTVYFTATAVIADLILLVWLLGYRRFEKRAWRLYAVVLLVVAAFELAVVVGAKGSWLITFISNLFHKPVDFHGRAPFWVKMTASAAKKPLLGYGLQDYDTLLALVGNGYGSHNYYLDMFQQRGALGLFTLLLMLLVPVWRGWMQKSTERSLYVVIGTCCAFAVILLTEPFYDTEYLFIPLFYTLFAACSRARALCFEPRYALDSDTLGGNDEPTAA